LQHACAQFDADCGEYPNTLSQLAVPHASRPLLADGTTAPVHTYQGPYLTGQGGVGGGVIPLNPFVAASVTKTETAGTTCGNARAHWVYDNNSGHIYSGIEGTCLDGTKFDQL
jgi:hypothetical protein